MEHTVAMSMIKRATFKVISARVGEIPAPAKQVGMLRTAHRWTPEYEPRDGYLYVRSRAISSRTNDNFDNFPADEIKAAWQTFIGKPVFVNHHNANHRRARGVMIDAVLHEDIAPDGSPDTWVEVLMEIDAMSFPKLAQAILSGKVNRTSMGTSVGLSICSFCGNEAQDAADFCKHIPAMKGQRIVRTDPDTGKREAVLVYEECRHLGFFENSMLVEDPADPTAVMFIDNADQATAVLSTAASRPVAISERYLDKMEASRVNAKAPRMLSKTATRWPQRRTQDGAVMTMTTAESPWHAPLTIITATKGFSDEDLGFPEEIGYLKWVTSTGEIYDAEVVGEDAWLYPDLMDEMLAWAREISPSLYDGVDWEARKYQAKRGTMTTTAMNITLIPAYEWGRNGIGLVHALESPDEYGWTLEDVRVDGSLCGLKDNDVWHFSDDPELDIDDVNCSDCLAVMASHPAHTGSRNSDSPRAAEGAKTRREGYPSRGSARRAAEDMAYNKGLPVGRWDGDTLDVGSSASLSIHGRPNGTWHIIFDRRRTASRSLNKTAEGQGWTEVSTSWGAYFYLPIEGLASALVVRGTPGHYWWFLCPTTNGGNRVDIDRPFRESSVPYRTVSEAQQAVESEFDLHTSSHKNALGEQRAPREVDTLREDACPVCTNSSWDGESCNQCGFVKPPLIFRDPDLDQDKVDLRADQEVEKEDLACDNCGAVYLAEDSEDGTAHTAARDEDEDDEPEDEDGDGDEDGDDEPNPWEPDGPEAPRTVSAPETTPTMPGDDEVHRHKPERGDLCPACGSGTLMPKDELAGIDPEDTSVSEDAEAQTPEDDSEGEPKEASRHMSTNQPNRRQRRQGSQQQQRQSSGDRPMRPREALHRQIQSMRDENEASNREFRAALASLQREGSKKDQQIERLARRNRSLISALADVAKGQKTERVASLIRVADAANSANGEAVTPIATDDVESQGAAPAAANTSVTPDATTEVDEDTQALADNGDVLGPMEDVTELSSNSGPPQGEDALVPAHDNTRSPVSDKSADEDVQWSKSSSARLMASMRLARLQVQAGLAQGDDLVLGQKIASGERSETSIREEIEVLSKVAKRKDAPQENRVVSRRAVPRSERSTPSLAPRAASNGSSGVSPDVASTVEDSFF